MDAREKSQDAIAEVQWHLIYFGGKEWTLILFILDAGINSNRYQCGE